MARFALLALALTGANAFLLDKRDSADDAMTHLLDACYPMSNSTEDDGAYDMNAPCNTYAAIVYKCTWNPDDDNLLEDEGTWDLQPQSSETQRDCICQSQHDDQVAGCMACMKAHGGLEGEHWYEMDVIEPAMSDYCNAEATPTEGYLDMVETLLASETPATSTESWTFSDPIGADVTAVSEYYTPSITGSAAIPSMPTPETSGGNVTYASVKTSDGQIVPTASADSGAMPAAMGGVGAIGIAALVAVL